MTDITIQSPSRRRVRIVATLLIFAPIGICFGALEGVLRAARDLGRAARADW